MTPQEIFNFFASERIKQLVNDESMKVVRLEQRPVGPGGEMFPQSVEYLNIPKILKLSFEFADEVLKLYPFEKFEESKLKKYCLPDNPDYSRTKIEEMINGK